MLRPAPLWEAAQRGQAEDVQRYLVDGANIDERGGPLESTPLHEAAWSAAYTGRKASNNGRKAVVKLLLERGADVFAKNKNGDTALVYAERQGHEDVARLLRDAEVTHLQLPAPKGLRASWYSFSAAPGNVWSFRSRPLF